MEDIKYRAYKFAVRVIKYLREQDWTKRMNEPLFRQLLRSSTSIGANIEGRSENSNREMIKYYRIALRSTNETKYWLCLLRNAAYMKNEIVESLLKETTNFPKLLLPALLQ